MNLQFATQSYKSAAQQLSTQRLVNLYAEAQPRDAKALVAVFGCPGLVLFATCGTGPVRAMRMMGGTLYVVSGQRLYSVSSTGAVTDVGGNILGSGPVSIGDNGTQVVIVNGSNGYIYSVAAGFQLIADADFNAAYTVEFFDGRFVFDETGTNSFFISETLDGTLYDSTEFASAETRPDNVKAVVLSRQMLLVFGESSTEAWQNVGAANFPFQRIEGAMIERGLAASLCTAKQYDDAGKVDCVFFLGDDRVFYKLTGINHVRVSTPAIERAWRDYASVTDAFAFSHTFNGHKFISVTFPSVPATWTIDTTTGLWHERESWDDNKNSYSRWRGQAAISAYGKELIGDAFSGRVGYLDNSTYTEYGNVIYGEAVCPPIHADGRRMFMPHFELDVETGVGLSAGQGSDPQIMLDISDDGGRTWGNRQIWRSAGKMGEYRKRLRWSRLGSFFERHLRITVSDPIPRTIIAARAPGTKPGMA